MRANAEDLIITLESGQPGYCPEVLALETITESSIATFANNIQTTAQTGCPHSKGAECCQKISGESGIDQGEPDECFQDDRPPYHLMINHDETDNTCAEYAEKVFRFLRQAVTVTLEGYEAADVAAAAITDNVDLKTAHLLAAALKHAEDLRAEAQAEAADIRRQGLTATRDKVTALFTQINTDTEATD